MKLLKKQISDPAKNDVLDRLCSEAASTQEMIDELNSQISEKMSDIRKTKNALSKATQVCDYWKSLNYWHEVPKWQRVVNVASSLLSVLNDKSNVDNNDFIAIDVDDTGRSETSTGLEESAENSPSITSLEVSTFDDNQTNGLVIDTVDGEAKELSSVFIEAEKNKNKRKSKYRLGNESGELKR